MAETLPNLHSHRLEPQSLRQNPQKEKGQNAQIINPTVPLQKRGNYRLARKIFRLFPSMARIEEAGTETPATLPDSSPPPSSFMFLLRIMSRRRTWACIFVLVYGILLVCSWNFLKSMLSWYNLEAESSSSGWPAVYASVLLGVVFGVVSMAAALAVMVPAILVTWIAVVVLLAFFGKPRKALVEEGRKITREIFSYVIRVLLKEGNVVAALCAVLGYFALLRKNGD